MIRVVNQDDGVVYDNPRQDNHPQKGNDAEGCLGKEQRQNHSHRAERNGEDNDEGVDEGFELRGHDQVDQKDGQGERQQKAPIRGGQFFVLSSKHHVRVRRQLPPQLPQSFLNFIRNAVQIPSRQIR